MYAPPLRYKRGALAAHDRLSHKLSSARCTHQALRSPSSLRLSRDEGNTRNTTHSGRRVLRSGGPNHSKPAMSIVFLHLDRTNPSYPPSTHPLGFRRVHYATRLWVCTPRHLARQVGEVHSAAACAASAGAIPSEDLRLLLLLNESKIEGSGTQLKQAPNFVTCKAWLASN